MCCSFAFKRHVPVVLCWIHKDLNEIQHPIRLSGYFDKKSFDHTTQKKTNRVFQISFKKQDLLQFMNCSVCIHYPKSEIILTTTIQKKDITTQHKNISLKQSANKNLTVFCLFEITTANDERKCASFFKCELVFAHS